jgi:uncharacterized protein with ParB-like and HNH nuclease domain
MYQTGNTIKETLDKVHRHDFVLPAIQREFVWQPEQICRLFDSLMQGYPFGTFLLWKVEAENSSDYKFYDFVRDYHQRDKPHCEALPTRYEKVTAVLDGQQRLTALNIGLSGSMAIKKPRKRWNNPDAFPQRFLYLDLLHSAEPEEEGDQYLFEFLTSEQVEKSDSQSSCWYRVSDILQIKTGPPMLKWLNERLQQEQTDQAFEVLDQLYRVIHTAPTVAHYEETSQDLSTVLNIFIRMNSGGTQLSYSDLLLSIAVAQWEKRDARSEIHSLVDEINQQRGDFDFSQDLVLKAGLVLTDIKNVGFKVENFNRKNMKNLEQNWTEVRRSLLLAVRLISTLGFDGKTFRAKSALLPIAYYIHQRKLEESYLTTAKHAEDRKLIQLWLTKSLLKSSGVWGSGLDTLLTALRDIIQKHGQDGFPLEAIEEGMSRRGKGLRFESEEIEDLLDGGYKDSRTFALLALLFPFVDLNNQFHIDHIFPSSRFTKPKLRKENLSEEKIEQFIEDRDGLANLQLLEGPINTEKSAKLPSQWLDEMYSTEEDQRNYCDKHMLGTLPRNIFDFGEFYQIRRNSLRKKIHDLLGVPALPTLSSGKESGEDLS